jgi:RNA polymerase sigma-70 factor, ECF subfamily
MKMESGMYSQDETDQAYQLMLTHRGLLYKLIRSFPVEDMDANDMWSEIYINVSKSWVNFRQESKPVTWLYRVAINTILQFKRKRPHLPRALTDDSVVYQNFTEVQMLESALLSLPEFDRLIITMYLEGFTQQEIADNVGITTSQVGVRVHRIKKKLQAWIKIN